MPKLLSHIDPIRFQQLCSALLLRLYPGLRPVDGTGGDDGVDAWDPLSRTFFQCHAPTRRVQRTKFGQYLSQATQHSPARWIFITNQDFTRAQWTWVDGLIKHVPFPVEVWGVTKLGELLATHSDLTDYFFPADISLRSAVTIGSQRAQHISNVAAEQVTLNVRTTRAGRPRIHVSGVVSNEPRKLGYLKYLGHRFNDLKERQVGKERMRYQLIWVDYRRFVGYNVAETPLEAFEMASQYLQERITKSKVGQILFANGKSAYETFHEFLARTSSS